MHHIGDPCQRCGIPHDEVPVGPCAGPRDFRVFWQSLFNPHSKNAYPAQEPLMTLEEARAEAAEQHRKHYLRAHVIDRKGHMA